jgi:ribosomal protein L7/L12
MPLLPISQRQFVLPLSLSLKYRQRWFTKRRLLINSGLSNIALVFDSINQSRLQQTVRRNYGTSKTILSPEVATAISTPTTNAEKAKTTAPFQYPKAEELFRRILQRCETKDDARALQRTVYVLLGKPLRDFEFLIDGFGGKKSKHGGSGGGSGGEASEPVKEVQKIFDVKLVAYDSTIKLKVIKEIRTILPGLGLKEAKELVESAPCTIQKGLQPEQAEAMKQKLTEIGAQIELV